MRVNEIFNSIDGEINCYGQGRMTTFIRLQGCNRACKWCDSRETQSMDGGRIYSVTDVFNKLIEMSEWWRGITITGGEPLLQMGELVELVQELKQYGKEVVIETNGTMKIPNDLSLNACIVADLKMPGSGQYHPDNIHTIQNASIIKFVIDSDVDFDVAVTEMKRVKKMYDNFYTFAFSPTDNMDPVWLHKLMRKKTVDAVLNIQIHKRIGLE